MIEDFQRPPARRTVKFSGVRNPPYKKPETLLATGDIPELLPTGTSDISPTPIDEPLETDYTHPESESFTDTDPDFGNDDSNPPVKKRFNPFHKWHRPTRKQALIIATVLVLLGASITSYILTRPNPVPVASTAPKKVKVIPPPKPILSPLTGLVVTAEQQARPVTGVMIENSPDARPQSGLKEAGVVYEAIAEAGITRFLTLFQESNPGNVGPIRSARPYYLDWLMPFDASLAHVGGSPDALARIKEIGVRDLDQFANSGSFHRITTRYAPHNVYTDIDTLVALGSAKGYAKSTFTGFERKAKEEPAKVPTAKTIDLGISSSFYNVHYDYEPTTNAYNRSLGGAPHLDMESKAQLAPKVVIGLVMPYSLMADGQHSAYGTTGTGIAYFFQDGLVTTGSWTKPDYKTQFVFKDDAGKVVKLNPGQTWLSVVGDAANVTYAP